MNLRNLPAVDALLKDERVRELEQNVPRRRLKMWAQAAVRELRGQILGGREFSTVDAAKHAAAELVVAKNRTDLCRSLRHVINATGVLLHTNLGRAPLADRTVQRMQRCSAGTNLELDLESGKRSGRASRCNELLIELTGAEDAVIVNNCAAATMLVLQCLSRGPDVIVSRGQLVEIGGGFRLPEVFQSGGAALVEVGTTNRTYLRDYQAAISDDTGAIMRVHRSNFTQSGFVTEPTIAELAGMKLPGDVLVIDDLGSGLVTDLSGLGLSEPRVQDSVAAGADLCLFSGDKLFGGPQCGMIVGKSEHIARIRSHPMMRALRCDKLTLSALEATAEVHLEERAWEEIPLFVAMGAGEEQVAEKCEAVIRALAQAGFKGDIVYCRSQIGGGSLPGLDLPSRAVSLRLTALKTLEGAARELRIGVPAVMVRVHEEQILLDMRTVHERDIELLARRLCETLSS